MSPISKKTEILLQFRSQVSALHIGNSKMNLKSGCKSVKGLVNVKVM